MKIALIGYGKMGKEIEKIILQRGHEVHAKLTSKDELKDVIGADVAIEFTRPESTVKNMEFCIEHAIPVVVGTTGWMDQLDDLSEKVDAKKGGLLYASNFSLGVNIFFEINEYLAKLMDQVDGYSRSVLEIHHTEKLDAPSGTGISLAEGIIENTTNLYSWENCDLNKSTSESTLNIESQRLPNVPGTHEVYYQSEIDDIEIKHTAHSRVGFAKGAVIAAEYLLGKQGVFTMKDVLKIKS
jgi:4-hydroxy-tetrahydrodipicolinate reductase